MRERGCSPSGIRSHKAITRSAAGNPSGRSSAAWTMLKMAVEPPIPSASVSVAAIAKPGCLRNIRAPYRKSCHIVCIVPLYLIYAHCWPLPHIFERSEVVLLSPLSPTGVSFQHYVKNPRLETLPIHRALLYRDGILRAVHRIVLPRVVLKMDLSHQRLVSRTDC